jgi:hypothetical protein
MSGQSTASLEARPLARPRTLKEGRARAGSLGNARPGSRTLPPSEVRPYDPLLWSLSFGLSQLDDTCHDVVDRNVCHMTSPRSGEFCSLVDLLCPAHGLVHSVPVTCNLSESAGCCQGSVLKPPIHSLDLGYAPLEVSEALPNDAQLLG